MYLHFLLPFDFLLGCKFSAVETKMKDIKKCLRSEQWQLEAQKRNNCMTEIMELSETNDKKFYSLVNHQRQHNDFLLGCKFSAVETSVSQIEQINELTLLTVNVSTCFNFNFISISTNFSYSFKSTLSQYIEVE
jgi:hypothetical protein